MLDDKVIIKGVKDGLLIALSPTEEWLQVTGQLAERIDQQKAFFSGASITVDLGERPVTKHEMGGLKALLERRGLTLSMVLSDSATSIDAAQALDLRTMASHEDHRNEALPISPEVEGDPGVLIRQTLRSGRVVHSAGHVVVYGDVNPGAEIIAVGDIIVWGNLRGNVHAGADGNEEAVVCALNMIPTQLRIAGYITTSPKAEKRRKPKPEIALIRHNQIVVKAWDK
ncbi:MAG: septum site-determining protein MinC [Anaerolineae bacterium]